MGIPGAQELSSEEAASRVSRERLRRQGTQGQTWDEHSASIQSGALGKRSAPWHALLPPPELHPIEQPLCAHGA